ncbi:MAG: carboxylating nicotinate-nucleotide diphosphorylase [Gemmataceae bacterium]
MSLRTAHMPELASTGGTRVGKSSVTDGAAFRCSVDNMIGMNRFTDAEARACRRLVQLAASEDLGLAGDLTTDAFIPADQAGAATFVARRDGVLAGLPAVEIVVELFDLRLKLTPLKDDGDRLAAGDRIATVRGPMRGILSAERTALNFLQRLSGVATQTRRFVDLVADLPVKLLDTRKTTPGWRLLEKYAVRQGGGHNHRVGLYDMILIKDNHLAALVGEPDPVAAAVQRARQHSPGVPVEVEVDTLDQLDRALACGPDMILLDNMDLNQLGESVRRRNAAGSKALLEASGGVTLTTLRGIAETGVDRISVGALTHSAVALDIALDYGE